MITDPFNEYPFAIEPNSSAVIEVIDATFFYLVSLNHSHIAVKINEGKKRTGGQAKGHNYENVEGFVIEKVEIFNNSVLELTGTLQVGLGSPLDNNFNVNADEVTPTLRDEVPSIIDEAVSEADVAGLDEWVPLVAADEFRESVELWTDAAALAYWAPNTDATESGARNIVITSGLPGVLKIRSKSAIYVMHKEAGTQIVATVHKFA